MEDYLIRATAAGGAVRAFAATTKNTVEKARNIHQTTPVVSAALGRLLTAGAIMGAMLKEEKDLITLQIRGNGPIQGIVVTADWKSNVKGYVFEPNVEIPLKAPGKLDVGAAIGKGELSIIKDIGLKDPYCGRIELVSGEIADDLTYYFAKSEQTPSTVSLGVLVDVDTSIKQSGGFFIQLMPNVEDAFVERLEKRLGELESITSLLEQGKTPEEILKFLLEEENLVIMDKRPIEFYCNCSRQKVEKALISIGKEDIRQILQEDKETSLHCHFCNKEYHFSEQELKDILSGIEK